MIKLNIQIAPSNCSSCGANDGLSKGELFSNLREIYKLGIGKCIGISKCREELSSNIQEDPNPLADKVENSTLYLKIQEITRAIIDLCKSPKPLKRGINNKPTTYYDLFLSTDNSDIKVSTKANKPNSWCVSGTGGHSFSECSRPPDNDLAQSILSSLTQLKKEIDTTE